MADNESISKPVNLSSLLPKKTGIAAKVAAAKDSLKDIDPTKVPNRLGIIFDDSGSMSGDKIDQAHGAVEGFSQSCNPRDTSLCVYPLCHMTNAPLTIDYSMMVIFVRGIGASGGTPLYSKSLEMLQKEPITRGVVFSDGEPNYNEVGKSVFSVTEQDEVDGNAYESPKDKCINLAREKKVPFDTVYIGGSISDKGAKELKDFADKTGGIFLHFTDISVFRSNLKYLAPANRGMLMNAELKEKIQRGEKI